MSFGGSVDTTPSTTAEAIAVMLRFFMPLWEWNMLDYRGICPQCLAEQSVSLAGEETCIECLHIFQGERKMKVLGMTVAELIKRGAFVDVHLHNTDEKTGTAFVKEMTGQDAEQREFDDFTSYCARIEGAVSVTSYVRRRSEERRVGRVSRAGRARGARR